MSSTGERWVLRSYRGFEMSARGGETVPREVGRAGTCVCVIWGCELDSSQSCESMVHVAGYLWENPGLSVLSLWGGGSEVNCLSL